MVFNDLIGDLIRDQLLFSHLDLHVSLLPLTSKILIAPFSHASRVWICIRSYSFLCRFTINLYLATRVKGRFLLQRSGGYYI